MTSRDARPKTKFEQLFDLPEFGDAERTRRGQLLYRILLAAYPVLIALTVAALFGDSRTAHTTYPVQCLVVLIVLVLLRRGRVTPAAALMLTSIWGLSSITILEEGGAGSAAMGSYALTVLMAGFFWSFRGALAVATVTSISTAILVWEPRWLGLTAFPRQDPARYFAETAAQIWVTALLLHFALQFIRQAVADKHRAELATAEARLELEKRQRETQKFEAIGRLAAGVAHDFNNLLMVIVGEIDVARRKHPSAELSGASDAALRAGRLVNELLAIGRKQELSARPFELNKFLRDLEPVLRRVLGTSSELDLVPGSDDYWVQADPHQLERVLINLVANARDATLSGGRVRVESTRQGNELRVTVEDRGNGMTPEIQARIFEPFFSTKGDAGTGLGLATAEGIVAQSGGRLAVESRVGVGTRMHVFLPASSSAG